MKYIALLRGINVSGQKIIKMAELRAALEKEGFESVQTYIQSGNIVFESASTDIQNLEVKIHQLIQKYFGFDVPVMVLEAKDIEQILVNCAWLKDSHVDPKRLYFSILSHQPEQDAVDALDAEKFAPEEFIIGQKVIYLHSPNGLGRSKLNNNYFEQKLKVKATTRNLNTLNKLLAMCQ